MIEWIAMGLHGIGKFVTAFDTMKKNKSEKLRQCTAERANELFWIDYYGKYRLKGTDEICFIREDDNGDKILVSSVDNRIIHNYSKDKREKIYKEAENKARKKGDVSYFVLEHPKEYNKHFLKNLYRETGTGIFMIKIRIRNYFTNNNFPVSDMFVNYDTGEIMYISDEGKFVKLNEDLKIKYKDMIDLYKSRKIEANDLWIE